MKFALVIKCVCKRLVDVTLLSAYVFVDETNGIAQHRIRPICLWMPPIRPRFTTHMDEARISTLESDATASALCEQKYGAPRFILRPCGHRKWVSWTLPCAHMRNWASRPVVAVARPYIIIIDVRAHTLNASLRCDMRSNRCRIRCREAIRGAGTWGFYVQIRFET